MQFIQLVISGLAQGCIYGLIALGFVLIYKATETVNFAQGELLMIGGFAGLFAATTLGMPYWAVIIVAMAVTASGEVTSAAIASASPPSARHSAATASAAASFVR